MSEAPRYFELDDNSLYSYFAGEIIGNVLDVEARRWRRPKRVDFRMNESRIVEFKKKYSKFDWTGMISQ